MIAYQIKTMFENDKMIMLNKHNLIWFHLIIKYDLMYMMMKTYIVNDDSK